jgi:hypothetical protein
MALIDADAAGAEPDAVKRFRTARSLHDLLAASAVPSPLARYSCEGVRLAGAGRMRISFARVAILELGRSGHPGWPFSFELATQPAAFVQVLFSTKPPSLVTVPSGGKT